jgi:hypothetical protein
MLNPKLQDVSAFYKIIDEYQESDSKSLFSLLYQNLSFKSIIIKNFYELNKLMRTHNSSSIDSVMWGTADSRPRQKIQEKINRLLFNYLSALFGYIDFHRSHNLDYLKTNQNINSKARLLNSFKEDQVHKFIQDLRNFTLHYRPLSIVSELAYNIEWDGPRRNIYVKKDDLLSWSNWTTTSRTFIETKGDKVYVFDTLKSHFSGFINHQLEIFRLLLEVSPTTTNQFRDHLEKMFHHSSIIGATGSLPFNRGFLRYINYQADKSKHNA